LNAFLFILTGLIVLTGSALVGLAPIIKRFETRLRIIGVCCTAAGGFLGIGVGLRSAKKTDTLMRNSAQILQKSDTALGGINETLSTSKDILVQTRENLDKSATNLNLASKAARSSQEASSFSSGGDSRPEIHAHRVTREDGKEAIGFYLTKRGKYPLYGLTVVLGKPHRSAENRNTLLWEVSQACRSIQLPQEMQIGYTIPFCFEPLPKEDSTYYEADMSARNGHWDEVIRIVKTANGDLSMRWALFETRDITMSPNKQVFDLADADFPPNERWEKIHPLREVLP
jgi:hypothetical protein